MATPTDLTWKWAVPENTNALNGPGPSGGESHIKGYCSYMFYLDSSPGNFGGSKLPNCSRNLYSIMELLLVTGEGMCSMKSYRIYKIQEHVILQLFCILNAYGGVNAWMEFKYEIQSIRYILTNIDVPI